MRIIVVSPEENAHLFLCPNGHEMCRIEFYCQRVYKLLSGLMPFVFSIWNIKLVYTIRS